jgi:putative salt-induced outer membrane protein
MVGLPAWFGKCRLDSTQEYSMKCLGRLVAGCGLALVAAVSVAQDEEEGLSGRVALGYLATSGNSESENLSLIFGGDYHGEIWNHNLEGRAVRASTSGITTAEAYALSWQSERDLSERSYIFGRAAWDKDKFSGYDQQLREVVGYGRRFIDNERHELNGEGGVGLRQSDLRNGLSEDESIVRLSMDYTFQLSDTAEFRQRLGIESGSDNTYTETVTSLSADVWTNLAIVLSYTIKRNSDVPVGTVRKDTFTSVALEYSF